MEAIDSREQLKCYHCGDDCHRHALHFQGKSFCCSGCQTIYDLLRENQLTAYYDLRSAPGTPRSFDADKFIYLDNQDIAGQLLDFSSPRLQKVNFSIPVIHCSSCIWLLEHLSRLHQGILGSRVNFTSKELWVDFDPSKLSLRQLVELLADIGYEPHISLEERKKQADHKIKDQVSLKIGVAGFCFGNIMLLSFPEYLGLDFGEDAMLRSWFSWIMLALALPVVFYCAQDYFISAFLGLKQRYLNIDVPIVLGILALFSRSVYEILFDVGPGYLDSLSGLLFLLLLGKWFQSRTYQSLSFERDFKAYFPLAVTRQQSAKEESVLVNDLRVGDIMLIRHQELIPADSSLLDEQAEIDYSFISGESRAITRYRDDHIYAGGRHLGARAHYQVIKPVSQSYLTQLWNHQTFSKPNSVNQRKRLVDVISKYFTAAILMIASAASVYWMIHDPSKSLFVFAAVLIVACPCALSMATPFTLGTAMRILGRNKLYLKNSQVIEDLAQIDTIIFDKTGTLTETHGQLHYFGQMLDAHLASKIAALVIQSNHPLSQDVHTFLSRQYPGITKSMVVEDFQEKPGQGISGRVKGMQIKLGNASFTNAGNGSNGTYLSVDDHIIGCFQRTNQYRQGLVSLFRDIRARFKLQLLSGDGDYERELLSDYFPGKDTLHFNQSPLSKLEFLKNLQQSGSKVMMLGDGLNDAGALQQSDAGIAVTPRVSQFSPASDGILEGSSLVKLIDFLNLARRSRKVIAWGFGLSFVYNILGLGLAVTANLTPLAAAILMPLSSISVVAFSTASVNLIGKRLKLV